MSKYLTLLILSFGMVFSGACGDSRMHSQGVYMLVDTSGTYAREMKKKPPRLSITCWRR